MNGNNLKDLTAFLMVAEEGNFTRAAARLGISQSALSQVIRGLEARLELRLFARTTRSVSLTPAGEKLLQRVGPAMAQIDAGLQEITELRDRPAGTVRINADEYAVLNVLQPAISRALPGEPDICVELSIDYGLSDIVSGRYDAGVRRGGLVARDMIAVQISPPHPMAVVASPDYLARRPAPRHPQQLTEHACINLRLPTHGEYFPWVFAKAGKEQRIKVDGQFVGNNIASARDAALTGLGLAYLPREYVLDLLERGELVEVLGGWCKTFEPYYLYYPSRLHHSAAFLWLLDVLRNDLKAASHPV